MKQVLDIKQMQHLQEMGLELPYPLLCWVYVSLLRKHELNLYRPEYGNKVVPACTLQDILSLLPPSIEAQGKAFELEMSKESIWYVNYDGNEINYFLHEAEAKGSLCDAAYEMLCWCIENGYMKTTYKEEHQKQKRK